MICHGDEMGRTQAGNNNVYCQDNELSWVNWNLNATQQDLLHFTRKVIKLRKDHPVLRRRRFFYGDAAHGGESKLQEIGWLRPSGEHMRDEDWTAWYARSLMVYVNGHAISEPNLHGERSLINHSCCWLTPLRKTLSSLFPPSLPAAVKPGGGN